MPNAGGAVWLMGSVGLADGREGQEEHDARESEYEVDPVSYCR